MKRKRGSCRRGAGVAALAVLQAMSGKAIGDEVAPKARVDAIVVTGARVEQGPRELTADVSVVTGEEIRDSAAQTVLELMRTLPGLQFGRNGGDGKLTNVFVRGTNPNQVLVLIDGVRVASATSGTAALHNLPLTQVERIEVLRGPSSALYGSDAIGGVIQIFTRRGEGASSANASVGAGSHRAALAEAGIGGSTDGTRYAVGAAYRRTDGINAIANPANFNFDADRDGFSNLGASLSFDQRIADRHRAGVNVLYSQARNRYDSGFPARDFDYRNDDVLASLSLWSRHGWTQDWTTSVRLSRGIDRSENIVPASATDRSEARAVFRTEQDQLSVQNDLRIGPATATVGYEHVDQAVSGTTRYTLDRRRVHSVYAGAFATHGSFGWQANARVDRNSQYGTEETGMLAAGYALTPSWRAGGSIGRAFRAPTFNELYFPGFGNPDLAAERATSAEVFLRHESASHSASLTAYRNRVGNLIAFAGPNFEPINLSRAEITGLTATFDFRDRWMSAGVVLDALSPEDASGGANDGKLLPRRARRAGSAHVTLRSESWDARVELSAQGERFDDLSNTRRLGGYAIVNVVAGYRIARDWSLRLRVENVGGKRYELAADYSVPRHEAMLILAYSPGGRR